MNKLNERFSYTGQFALENLLPGLRGQSIGSNLPSIDFSGVTTFNLPAGQSFTSTSPTGGGIGYATGAGGAVTQATNRATGVTINKLTGTITTNNASLAAETSAVFVVTNSTVAVGDTIILSQQSGATGLMTTVEVTAVAAGSFSITVSNNVAAAGAAETGAILINFAVLKAVSA